MFDIKKMSKKPLYTLIMGVVLGVIVTLTILYKPWAFENFGQYSPSTEEVIKIPFYERLAATEDMGNPDIKRVVIKAAYIAAKDNHDMKEKLKKLMVDKISASIDTDASIQRLKTNYDRKIVNEALKETRIAVQNGAKQAIAQADNMVTEAVMSVTQSPTPGPSVPQQPLPF
tara:strand:+ start:1530 stop:2045 length:516 start_codon:yes stop_codon:yes gene_type:complete